MVSIPKNANFVETYGKALAISEKNEADEWMEALMESYMCATGASSEEATRHVRRNLWAFACHAGYRAMYIAEFFYGCER